MSPAWAADAAARTAIPVRAVTAYGRAVLLLDGTSPGCHLGWTTLAAIGEVESDHGTLGHRRLRADGRTTSPIIGPALDRRGYAAIPAAGDAVPERSSGWAHALGPMQFIPSTWQVWASDADGDGLADPDDLEDASYSAARYLCAAGGDLAIGQGWARAIWAYNHSADYVSRVHATAVRYDDQLGGRPS